MSKFIIFLLLLKAYLSGPTCKKGTKNCSLCNPITDLCIKCEYDVFISDKYGGCKMTKKCILGKNNCIECTNEGNLCKKCNKGYFPDENGGCSYSPNCEISYKGICLKCQENFILNERIKICKSIDSEEFRNCEIIDRWDATCEKCKEGYFLSSEDKKCTKTENCKEVIFDKCIKCDLGYYLDIKEEKCFRQSGDLFHCKEVIDGKNCINCDDDFYFDEEKKCSNSNYCLKSGELGICETCISGYYLSEFDKICTNTEFCYEGIKNIGVCEKCKSGFYMDFKDGKCKSNEKNNNFKFCKEAKENCIECISGYYLGEDYKCSTNKFCAESINGTCVECKNNYYLGLDKKCTTIEHCIYSYDNECEECENNFYYEKNSKKCKEWGKHFENCKYGHENKGCERCKNDFYLNQTDYLCYNNNVNNSLYKCAMTDLFGKECIFCVDNYYLGNRCSKIPGCDYAENEDRCLECNSHYCLDVKTGFCVENDKLNLNKSFYFLCRKTNENGTACDKCLEGFLLHDNGTCIQNLNNDKI